MASDARAGGRCRRVNSLRSTPAQKAGSAPVTTIAPTSGADSARVKASMRPAASVESIALRASGRLSVMTATPLLTA